MTKKKFYVTTTIYYVNDVPHIGHAYTTLAGDVVSRYWKQKLGNNNVFFLTGTDEHGQKVAQSAEKKGVSPKEFVDTISLRFQEAWKLLDIKYDHFIRTTDPRHKKIAQEVLQKVYDAGYIYEGEYEGLYCVECEKFLTETDLVDGKCPFHPNQKPIYQKEKNYFLKFKDLVENEVLPRIESGEYQILPKKRENEVVSRIKQGIEDISISRENVAWGIPIPWDKSQTIYVWVEALANYYTATQFIKGKKKFWPADVHLIGKDILWFHAVIWQALLVAAGLDLPKTIFAHGFFTIDGQKISKSIGNTIAPKDLVEKYETDGSRYLIISAYPFGEDGDISFKRFNEKYNADLANGLGNLVSRVAKLAELSKIPTSKLITKRKNKIKDEVGMLIENYELDKALNYIIKTAVATADKYITEQELWNNFKKATLLQEVVTSVVEIAEALEPFLPKTAERIKNQFTSPNIKSGDPLFPRLK